MRQDVDKKRVSTHRKRSSSRSEGYDLDAKRRTVDVMDKSTSSKSDHGGAHITSYPLSSLYYSPSPRDIDVNNRTFSSHYQRLSPGNVTGPIQSTKRDLMERSSYPSCSIEEGYPGQYDLRDYSYVQQSGEMCQLNYEFDMPPVPSYSSPRTKQNRFNLSRYQLDADDDFVASHPASEPEEKPNRFKTQRERLMLAAKAERSRDVSGSSDPSVDETSLSLEDADSSSESQSQSQDSYMSQRERLRRFSSEQSPHVVIPNEWEGETKLQEFVAFGNIEAALRPLGLMMARAALVSDSVNPRHHRGPVYSGPPACHTTLSNPLKS